MGSRPCAVNEQPKHSPGGASAAGEAASAMTRKDESDEHKSAHQQEYEHHGQQIEPSVDKTSDRFAKQANQTGDQKESAAPT